MKAARKKGARAPRRLVGVGRSLFWGIAFSIAGLSSGAVAAGEVNLYTDRQEVFLRTIVDNFSRESGVKVNILFAKSGLLERIRAEGEDSPADVMIVNGAALARRFLRAGLAAPVADDEILRAIPAAFRDSQNRAFALTKRARVLYVAAAKIAPAKIRSYGDLAAPEWRGKICIRSGRHRYNVALVADYVRRRGAAAARDWIAGIKRNLARKPHGNDRAQIRGVVNGECEIAVANSYYFFKMLAAEEPAAAEKIKKKARPLYPSPLHINATAMMLARHAPNSEAAILLMRHLVGADAQRIFAVENGEFPARDGVALPPLLAQYARAFAAAGGVFGGFDEDGYPAFTSEASRLIDEAGFDG